MQNNYKEKVCKLMKLLHDYGKVKNYAMKEIYEETMDYLKINETKMMHWNASEIIFQFLQEKLDLHLVDVIQEDVDLNNISFSNNDWPYAIASANNIFKLHTYARLYDWSTTKIGTFFIKTLTIIYKRSKNHKHFLSLGIKALHHLFTISEQEMSLIDIAYMYSLMDLKAMEELYTPFKDNSIKNKPSPILSSTLSPKKSGPALPHPPPPPPTPKTFDSSFLPCLKIISEKIVRSDHLTYAEKSAFSINDNFQHLPILPCNNLIQYPECTNYCHWHKNYFKQWPREEFLTIMRYALPQRKLSLEQVPQVEQRLAEKLFGRANVKDLKNSYPFWAPVSMALFCYKMGKGFDGDEIGISEKVCNDFFPAPTDVGICHTQNLDIKRIIHVPKNYEALFESEKQKSKPIFTEGVSWDEVSFGILVDKTDLNSLADPIGTELFGQSYPPKPNSDTGKIQFQIHQSKDVAPILLDYYNDNTHEPRLSSLSLKAGYEYVIQVYSEGLTSTEQFKSLSLGTRNCKLENDVEKSSSFKVYTKNNCKYECHVKHVANLCKCIPWDFIHKTNASECDIFGRTCFFKAMENIAKDPVDQCNCAIECDFINYKKLKIRSEKLTKGFNGIYQVTGKYFSFDKTGKVSGRKEFMDFFTDDNNSFHDQGFKNFLNLDYPLYNIYNLKRAKMYENMIIIRLKFMPPKDLYLIDVKYTIMDRIASFGGKFGIFTQLTGCSLLGLLSLMMVIWKFLFTFQRNYHRYYFNGSKQ